MQERIDLTNSRYETHVHGHGTDVATAIESSGILREGRWRPLRTRLSLELYGRRWSSEAIHDPDARTIEYRSRGAFFLRRVYTAEHVLTLAPDVHVDDVVSALLNYADERWPEQPDGSYRTFLVRRGPAARPGSGGRAYEAQLRPVTLRFAEDDGARRATASLDLVGLTTWALPGRPALIHFGPDRRPDDVRLRLKFATSIVMQLARGLEPIATPWPVETSGSTWHPVPDVRRVADRPIARPPDGRGSVRRLAAGRGGRSCRPGGEQRRDPAERRAGGVPGSSDHCSRLTPRNSRVSARNGPNSTIAIRR